MPRYEFVCSQCGFRFEDLTSIAGGDRVRCPQCGGKPERLYEGKSGFGVGAFRQKGSEPRCDGCCRACPHSQSRE